MGQKTDLKTIRSVKRDIYLVVLVGGLIILLIYITRKQGGYTIVSVILNTLIFAYGFQLLGDGKNILRICNGNCTSFFVDYIDLSEWNSPGKHGLLFFRLYVFFS